MSSFAELAPAPIELSYLIRDTDEYRSIVKFAMDNANARIFIRLVCNDNFNVEISTIREWMQDNDCVDALIEYEEQEYHQDFKETARDLLSRFAPFAWDENVLLDD